MEKLNYLCKIIRKNFYLLVCLFDFVLFFGVSEIDLSLCNGLQILGSFTRMILCGVGGDWAGVEEV